MLTREFSNLTDFLEAATSSFNGGFISEDSNRMAFMMPVHTFGHHVGDNWLILEKAPEGFIFSIESRVGSRVKAKTSSISAYVEDLSFEEWNEEVDEVLLRHTQKPEYLLFAQGKVGKRFEKQITGNNSGCLVTIVTLLFFSFSLFFLITIII
jgi:hypothetical protein